jgi:hypothetical protein
MGVVVSGTKEATTALRLAADGMKTQGSLASSATLGWVPESRWDSQFPVCLKLETENFELPFPAS